MKRIVCCIIALILVLNTSLINADISNKLVTKDLSKLLNENLSLSIELREDATDQEFSVQVAKNVDLVSDKKLYNANLQVKINNLDNNSKIIGKLVLNKKEFTIIAEGQINAYDVINKDDYLFGEYFGYLYQNNKPVREIGLSLEYSVLDKEYAVSSITLMPTSDKLGKDSSLVLNFGDMNVEMNHKFYEMYRLNQNPEDSNINIIMGNKVLKEEIFAIAADIPLVISTTKLTSTYGDLMYMAGAAPSTLNEQGGTQMGLRTWTNKANLRNYMANKLKKPIMVNTVLIREVKHGISNGTYLTTTNPEPVSGSTSFSMVLPYLIAGNFGWFTVPVTTSTTTVSITGSPTPNIANWHFKKTGSFSNTDAITLKPWADNNKNGIGVRCMVTAGLVTTNTTKNISWYGWYRYSATALDQTIHYTVYDTISKSFSTPIVIKNVFN